MAQKSTTCPACSGKLSLTGYERHLRTTTNPQCHQIYQQQLAYIPDSDPVHPTASSQDPQYFGDVDVEMGEELIFQQDGSPADLGSENMNLDHYFDGKDLDGEDHDDEDHDEDLDEDLDDDFDDDDLNDEDLAYAAELELAWEPEVQPFLATDDDDDDDENHTYATELDLCLEPEFQPLLATDHVLKPVERSPSPLLYWPDSPSSEPDTFTRSGPSAPTNASPSRPVNASPSTPNKRHDAEHTLHWDNIRVEHFPGTLAGTPILGASMQHKYEQYGSRRGDLPNPYAPFCSKLDWEFACWAKLCGPGSNAITELLKIEGVCTFAQQNKPLTDLVLQVPRTAWSVISEL
jgi:hypothetical protein